MNDNSRMLRNALIIALVLALVVIGLGILIYVGLARDRIAPSPTPQPTATLTPSPASTATPVPTEPSNPLVTVVGVVREYSPGALVIVLTPIEGSVEQVIVPENTRITFEDNGRASVANITVGQTLRAEGTLDALGRLIASHIVIVRLAESTETSTPRPRVTSTPVAADRAWKGEYYANRDLDGDPMLVRQDAVIDFDWEQGAPAPGMPVDGCSIRWRGAWPFDEGGYRFYAYSDDGIRIWIDGALIIDQWREQSATLASGNAYVGAGEHQIQVEYFESSGQAVARVWWEFQGTYPDWEASYFANPDLAGEPLVSRNDPDVRFDWGAAAPAPDMPPNNWSARWLRTVELDEGAYRFLARADDGIRVWVDGPMIIDEWHKSQAATYEGFIWLDTGSHEIRVEYYEGDGDARAHLWWEEIDTFNGWRGEYYANPDLSGRPAFVRDDAEIAFDWQEFSPGSGIPIDNYGARWSRSASFQAGDYRFYSVADDGVRILIDGELVVDEWRDSPAEPYESVVSLTEGEHDIVVEYYERGDQASISAGWELVIPPTSTATESIVPSDTPQPSATATVAPLTSTPEPDVVTATPEPALTAMPANTATLVPTLALTPTRAQREQ